MYRYTLYTEDDLYGFNTLTEAVAYAHYLMHQFRMHSVIVCEATGEVVYRT